MFSLILQRTLRILLILWIMVLLTRSCIYLTRIVNEFGLPPEPFFPEITACSDFDDLNNIEQKYLYYYRNLGVVCEN